MENDNEVEEWTGIGDDAIDNEPVDTPDVEDNAAAGPSSSPLPGAIGHLPLFPPSAPLSASSLALFNAAQARAGVVYLSRIPPGMQPPKVRHLMSAYGEVGRVFLQQEDPKRAYLRRIHTTTKKAHYTEGWVEFTDKRVARAVASLLNAQPIGGKKGTRWRDDVWTMKYLPRFKWSMLTEQIAHEAAVHRDRLRVELSQSRVEQREYLKQVELARVLDKRAERKRKRDEETGEGGEGEPVKRAEGKERKQEGKPKEDGKERKEKGEERERREAKAKRWKEREREKREERAEGDKGREEKLRAVLGSVF